ncbi:hypothetical protein PNOK_0083600 [Pyrrhoderma noxium]|uniref:Uncharacterized protein n=1 Tax=Pyrrhoderma noxium TaxID=2282107 RepID=A0A286UW25_9AGAM|nr:hypothetical protein PNOK_0083600 [Pyrrhoderma noxium]
MSRLTSRYVTLLVKTPTHSGRWPAYTLSQANPHPASPTDLLVPNLPTPIELASDHPQQQQVSNPPHPTTAPTANHQQSQQQQQQQGQVQPHPPPQQQQPQSQQQQQVAGGANDSYQSTGTSNGQAPLIAAGNWTKDLIRLAKTAELKKHQLTLQLQTAHIISAHQQLESKNKTLQDVKEQKNRLESERAKLLESLSVVNQERDKADMKESAISKECQDLKNRIQAITDGEYAEARRAVDSLRAELGQPPVPSLQQTLEEKSAAYLNERRLNGAPPPISTETAPPSSASTAKRHASESIMGETPGKRPRGRPKGSKNRVKTTPTSTAGAAPGVTE